MKPSLLQRLRRSASGALIATVTALAVTLPTAARAHPDATAASAGSSLALSALPLASITISAATTVSVGASAINAASTILSTAAHWTVLSRSRPRPTARSGCSSAPPTASGSRCGWLKARPEPAPSSRVSR